MSTNESEIRAPNGSSRIRINGEVSHRGQPPAMLDLSLSHPADSGWLHRRVGPSPPRRLCPLRPPSAFGTSGPGRNRKLRRIRGTCTFLRRAQTAPTSWFEIRETAVDRLPDIQIHGTHDLANDPAISLKFLFGARVHNKPDALIGSFPLVGRFLYWRS
jgi:hypothetical protein